MFLKNLMNKRSVSSCISCLMVIDTRSILSNQTRVGEQPKKDSCDWSLMFTRDTDPRLNSFLAIIGRDMSLGRLPGHLNPQPEPSRWLIILVNELCILINTVTGGWLKPMTRMLRNQPSQILRKMTKILKITKQTMVDD